MNQFPKQTVNLLPRLVQFSQSLAADSCELVELTARKTNYRDVDIAVPRGHPVQLFLDLRE